MDPLERSDPVRLGSITLRGRLGAGGMGRVYYGLTDDYDPVALKVIREDLVGRREVRDRFAREIDALRTVQCPHVAALVDASDEDEERPWFATEYIRGLNLKEYLDSHGPLGPEYAATLGALLAAALKDIHRAGLLHRDLKPGNVLLGRNGPKVIDLGLAALLEGTSDLTASGATLGTPPCMAPEQAASAKDVSAASDVYALGATLLFTLTGHYPYEARTVPALLVRIASPEVKPDLGGVPAEFEQPLAEMLAHDPEARPTVPQAYERLKALATASGISFAVATRRLVTATYVERDDDPQDVTPEPRPRRRDVSEFVKPGSVVARLADHLRAEYAADALF